MNSQKIGQLAEQQAYKFLQAKGLQLIERNYRCLYGEIDLIMQDKQEIVFIEVRVRSHYGYADAIESVSKRKQTKLFKTATIYLQHRKWTGKVDCRFDIIGISYSKTTSTVEWIEDAFPIEHF